MFSGREVDKSRLREPTEPGGKNQKPGLEMPAAGAGPWPFAATPTVGRAFHGEVCSCFVLLSSYLTGLN